MISGYEIMKESYSGIESGKNGLTPSFKRVRFIPRLWSDNEIRILRSLHSRGVPYKDIVFVLGRSYSSVCIKCHELGLVRRRRYTVHEDSIIRKYAGKKSASEIGALINRSVNSVTCRCFIKRILLRRYGENNESSKLSDYDVFLITELRNQGVSFTEIADKFECSGRHASAIYFARRHLASDYYYYSELKKSGIGLL
ncbi:hypothetical protein IPA61_004713 [Escherichia coli]|uniref:hypothetical protein n=1 Tax=Escherichia coli TaxID=562 RepID=UPI00075128C2|nr:hypothetical protein [Escherichia coli]EGK3895015.1 hypothetical protein [Escherichia coli]EGK3991718.1 hypothetical protein [Escherichia coli]KUS82562.1 hypothetical protein AWE77_17530 [Escherichia coli]KUS82568.1 hypothetical protein AWE77_17560 [Escherichia coli]HAZ3779273.1 hypothetical protein [Escherichia coli]